MLVKQMLPRVRERLAVIEAEAPVREAAYLMSKPHTDLVVVCSHGDMVGVVTKTVLDAVADGDLTAAEAVDLFKLAEKVARSREAARSNG
jgi:CBS domain-containing protein